jgi:hypothetical protein
VHAATRAIQLVKVKVKVKFTLEQATKTHRGVQVQLYSFFNLGVDKVGGQSDAPSTLPPRKTRYPLCRKLGKTQGLSRQARKITHLKEFDPRTVQSVASRYTVWAIPALESN